MCLICRDFSPGGARGAPLTLGEVGRFSFDPGQGMPLSIDSDHFTYLGKRFTCGGK